MEGPARMAQASQHFGMLVGGVVVEHRVYQLAGRDLALDGIEETDELAVNAVENFFSKMTRQRIRRGVFRSIADLQTAINAYLGAQCQPQTVCLDQIRRCNPRQTRSPSCTF
jgi:hypothetical protein